MPDINNNPTNSLEARMGRVLTNIVKVLEADKTASIKSKLYKSFVLDTSDDILALLHNHLGATGNEPAHSALCNAMKSVIADGGENGARLEALFPQYKEDKIQSLDTTEMRKERSHLLNLMERCTDICEDEEFVRFLARNLAMWANKSGDKIAVEQSDMACSDLGMITRKEARG